MNDTGQEKQKPSAGDNSPAAKVGPRRKAPKLKPRSLGGTKPELDNPRPVQKNLHEEKEPATPVEQSEPYTQEDRAPSDQQSLATKSSDSEPQTPSTPDYQEYALPEKRHPQAKRTISLKREKDAPPQVWQRHGQPEAENSQLLPLSNVGEVGSTINEVGNVTREIGSKAVSTVGNTAGKAVGNVTGALQQHNRQENEKQEQLRLRLDLNLDIEVQLKAKIHGDLTLQLLN